MTSVPSFLSFFMDEATWVANQSPCLRRQYGVAIVHRDTRVIYGCNERVTSCCNDVVCVRDRFDVSHGQNTEVGAEVHAEQAALISWPYGGYEYGPPTNWYFLIAGSSKGRPLYGVQLYPCYVCARMIKWAGFEEIYLRREPDGKIIKVSLEEIISYREQEWFNVDDA